MFRIWNWISKCFSLFFVIIQDKSFKYIFGIWWYDVKTQNKFDKWLILAYTKLHIGSNWSSTRCNIWWIFFLILNLIVLKQPSVNFNELLNYSNTSHNDVGCLLSIVSPSFPSSSNDLSLEKPVDTAMLLSLTGVSCILANQWHCSLTDNARNMQTILKGNYNES